MCYAQVFEKTLANLTKSGNKYKRYDVFMMSVSKLIEELYASSGDACKVGIDIWAGIKIRENDLYSSHSLVMGIRFIICSKQ